MHQEANYLWQTRFRNRCDREEIDNSGMECHKDQDSDIAFMKNSPTYIFIDSCILWTFFMRDTFWLAIEIMFSILRAREKENRVSVPMPSQQITHNSPHCPCPCLRFREAGQGICLEQHVQRLKDRNHDAIGSRVRQRILDQVPC